MVSFLLDVALGVLLMWWLYRDDHIAMLANMLVPAADVSSCGALCPGVKASSHSVEFSHSSFPRTFLQEAIGSKRYCMCCSS